MARRRLLLIPEGVMSKIKFFRFRCGNFAIELLSCKFETISDSTIDTVKAIKCNTILGGVMPYDAVKALADIGIEAKAVVVEGEVYDKVNFLTDQIDLERRVAVLTCRWGGHWVTVTGYNRNRKEFYVVDTAKYAKRDIHGLTTYTYHELMEIWGRQALLPLIASQLCARSPRLIEFRMRLWSPPFLALALA